jgi:PAS domain S-box-containing protein
MAVVSLEVAGGAPARLNARRAALGQAALHVHEALTREAVLAEMGGQLSGLGFGWQYSRLVEGGAAIALEGVSLSPSLLAAVQRLLGIRLLGFRLPVDGLQAVQAALVDRRAVLVDGAAVIAEVFPAAPRGVVRQIVGLLGAHQILIAPLLTRGQVIGTLSVWGNDLAPADLPAVELFAQQVATAHENARLYEQAETMREQAVTMRERSEGLLETAPDAIVVVDPDGRIVLANRRAEALFGYGCGELLGEPASRLAPQRPRPGHAERGSSALPPNGSTTLHSTPDVYARRQDGSEFPAEITLEHHQAGGQRFTVAIFRDLTERQQAAAAFAATQRLEGQLDGIRLAAREIGHLLNNDLAQPVVALDVLRRHRAVPAEMRPMIDDAVAGLTAAREHVHQLQQVVRVAIKPTPVGPALDLEQSADPDHH